MQTKLPKTFTMKNLNQVAFTEKLQSAYATNKLTAKDLSKLQLTYY